MIGLLNCYVFDLQVIFNFGPKSVHIDNLIEAKISFHSSAYKY